MLVTDRSGTEFCLCPQAPSCATAPEWICMIIVTYLIHDICLRKNIMFGKHDGNTKLNSLWDERVCCTQQAFPTIVLNKCPERVSILGANQSFYLGEIIPFNQTVRVFPPQPLQHRNTKDHSIAPTSSPFPDRVSRSTLRTSSYP